MFFYGPTVMSPEIQRNWTRFLISVQNSLCSFTLFLVTEGTVEKHRINGREMFHVLNENKFQLKPDNCQNLR